MNCPAVTTLEQAEAVLPSSVLPVKGLRRNADSTLTDDARKTIIDGLKSRAVDPTDPATKKKLTDDLMILLCSVNQQYQYLLKELYRRAKSGQMPEDTFINTLKDKNLFMLDIVTISRHIQGLPAYNGGSEFIEGWQNSDSVTEEFQDAWLIDKLRSDREMFTSGSYLDLRKEMVQITGEKNKVASNYLGIYGFLNLVAIGLIIYVAGSR